MNSELKRYQEAVEKANQRHKVHLVRLQELFDISDDVINSGGTGKEVQKMDFDFIGKCHDLVNEYRASLKTYTNKKAEIERDYKGNKLTEKITAHKASAPKQPAAVAKLRELAEVYNNYLDEQEAAALDSSNLTEDFKLLNLPVTLTASELQTLHARNADNPLFCRALSDYYGKHEDEYNVHLDLRDSVTVRRVVVADFTAHCIDYLQADDFEFKMAETMGYFTQADEMLKGNGLFKQPEAMEPDEELPEDETPEPDEE